MLAEFPSSVTRGIAAADTSSLSNARCRGVDSDLIARSRADSNRCELWVDDTAHERCITTAQMFGMAIQSFQQDFGVTGCPELTCRPPQFGTQVLGPLFVNEGPKALRPLRRRRAATRIWCTESGRSRRTRTS